MYRQIVLLEAKRDKTDGDKAKTIIRLKII